MLDGMKFAEQGMIQMSQKQDVIANNLANASTFGFRKDAYNTISFSDVMREQSGKSGIMDENNPEYIQNGGEVGVKTQLLGYTNTSYAQGPARETGNPFDVMLDDNGIGFFTVNTPEGPRYTRNGNFKLEGGVLVTNDGSHVQGLKGDIHLNGSNFELSEDGFVKVDGKVVDRLKISTFLNPRDLQKAGSYMAGPADKAIVLDRGIHTRQGYLEMSNVNPVQEMVEMLTVSRNYEANQKLLQSEDHILQKSANELGKVH